jgi:tripartite ATP-independent transporter DctP family solute receptor
MVGLCLAFAACGSEEQKPAPAASGEAAKPAVKAVTINFSHTMAPNSLSDLAAKKFKESLEAKSNGSLKVNVVSNCGLSGGDLVKAIEMLGTGDIDMHASAPTNAATFDARFYIFWMPFLFPDEASLAKVTGNAEVAAAVNTWFEPLGIRLLGIHNAGARQISNSVKPIRTPEDLNAMNIRVPGAQLFVDCFRDSFKANPTAMDFSEVYTALQQKTIDGQENPISVFTSSKFEEVQSHLSLWDYVRDATGWYLSAKTYEKLSAEQRAMVEAAAAEAIAWADGFVLESEKEQLKDLETKGVTITVLTPEEKQAFADACAPLYVQYESIIGKDVIDLFKRVASGQ